MYNEKREIGDKNEPEVITDPREVRDDQIPPDYKMWRRDVRLLSGAQEPAYYCTRDDRESDPAAWGKVYESIVMGFRWALETPNFADNETEDDDRSQEIGNMMSYALSQGLSEQEVVVCYRLAFYAASEAN